jgi:hypothetical protein
MNVQDQKYVKYGNLHAESLHNSEKQNSTITPQRANSLNDSLNADSRPIRVLNLNSKFTSLESQFTRELFQEDQALFKNEGRGDERDSIVIKRA